jgi:hypothetical protein
MTPFRVGLLLLSVCLVAAWQVSLIPESAIQMTVGPMLVPAVIVAGLTLASSLYAISAWRGRQADEAADPEHSALPGSQLRMTMLLSGGVVFMVTISFAGFLVPATVCGMLIARSFEAPVGFKSAGICAAISVVFWTLFSKVLGVGIGPATPFGF